ncbi:MAG: serine/threonine-protein kinase [Halioglobus sp.]
MSSDQRVGPYKILRLINRGGQGSVYLGYDERLHRRVAIKIYVLPAQRAARKRLLQEARLVASIQSPKVVQIHDVIESSEHLALIMEYVPGCDLEEFLQSVRPSLATVLAIGADIAGALAVARQQHIVHGDLKAGNVLISDSGRVKLTDFGISQRMSGNIGQTAAAGSFSALSPEQYLGKPLDLRSDLFALGVLLYRMLGGEQPFIRDGQLDPDLLLDHAPRPLEEIISGDVLLPDPLRELVENLLQKNPAERPANTHRVRQVLRQVSRKIPLAAGNSLLQEARPCFRHESADDIPLQVPADLGREGRSRLGAPGDTRTTFAMRLSYLGWPARTVTTLALVAALCVPLVIAMADLQMQVHIEQPVLRFATDTNLPAEISASWLVEEVKLALQQEFGVIHVTGPVGATRSQTLYASSAGETTPVKPRERLQIALRCIEDLCVLVVTRKHAGQLYYQQGVLFPDMSTAQWRDIVRGTVAALYQ